MEMHTRSGSDDRQIELEPQNNYVTANGIYERDSKMAIPKAILMFSAIEIVTFCLDMYFPFTASASNDGPANAVFTYFPEHRHEVWRFVSHMLVHSTAQHIVFNVFYQLIVAITLETTHSWWRVAIVYLAGVLTGCMASSLITPALPLRGASGGIYALMSAHIATVIMNWSEMQYALFQLALHLVRVLYDLAFLLHSIVSAPSDDDNTNHVCHLYGAVGGLLVGIIVLRNLRVRRWERKLWWFAVIVYGAPMLGGIAVHLLRPQYFPRAAEGSRGFCVLPNMTINN